MFRDEALNDNAMERNALLTPIEHRQKRSVYSMIAGLPLLGEVLTAGIPALTTGTLPQLATIDFLDLGVYTAIFSGVAFFAADFASKNNKYAHLTKTALGSNDSKSDEYYTMFGKMITAKSGKTLINSFPIYRDHDININAWVNPKSTDDRSAPTHTVNQYIVKDGYTAKLEQEVIANAETMWDLSADTLMESYGIQENNLS